MKINLEGIVFASCKKIIFPLLTFFFLILVGCNKEFNKALNSTDVAYILSQADAFVFHKKYTQALQLYERAAPMLREKEAIKDLFYKIAMTNLKNKNYTVAGNQFKNFYSSYSRDKRAEKALFYSAYSYYMNSPDYNLDQTITYKAIEEFQNFINKYPESKKISEVNTFIQKLIKKLEKKYFEIAKTYYDIMRYKAAVKIFEQFINDFPDSPLKEKAQYYRLNAQYKLAIHSDPWLKKERFEKTLKMIRKFKKFYPHSSYKEKITKIERKTSQNLKHIDRISDLKNDIINFKFYEI